MLKAPIAIDQPNVVKGFSTRFVFVCVLSGLPRRRGLYSDGARLCGTAVNTFRNWCTKDTPPGNFPSTVGIVDLLLKDTPWELDTMVVAAWMMCGDRTENPFKNIPLVGDDLLKAYLKAYLSEMSFIYTAHDDDEAEKTTSILFDQARSLGYQTIRSIKSSSELAQSLAMETSLQSTPA